MLRRSSTWTSTPSCTGAMTGCWRSTTYPAAPSGPGRFNLPVRLPHLVLGDVERLGLRRWHCPSRLLPELLRLNELNSPGEPAPWLRPHPSEQELHSYYGPVRRQAPHRYSVPSVSASARSLSPTGEANHTSFRPVERCRRSPSHVPCESRRPGSRRLHAGHHLASRRVARQAHPGRIQRPPGFDATCNLRRFNGDVRLHRTLWNVFLVPT